MQKPETWISICFSFLKEEIEIYISTSAAGEAEPVLAGAASVFSEKFRLYLKEHTSKSEDRSSCLGGKALLVLSVGWQMVFYFILFFAYVQRDIF